MDNFGIFKLLSGFYDFYKKNQADLAHKNSPDGESVSPEKPNPTTTPKPINAGMLRTIKTHDEIVNRVLKNKHP